MSDNKFKGTYRIPSARAQWHDYEGGEYFVTICTQNREHFFGEIVNGEMRLSEVGKCLMEQIEKTSQMRPDMNIDIPLFVIMPNHVHLVIFIGNNEYNAVPVHRRDAMHCVSTCKDAKHCVSTYGNTVRHEFAQNGLSPQSKNLSSIVRGIKIGTTVYARRNNIRFAWQARFHDRIIRDQEEMNRIAEYIENNVAQWEFDGMNQATP